MVARYNPLVHSPKEKSIVITTDLLIPGRGEPQKNKAVVLQDAKITKICDIEDLSTTSEHTTHVPVLLPGLWDCHAHYIGAQDFKFDDMANVPLALAGSRCALDVYKTLMSGFTSVRELLGFGVHLEKVIREGTLPGPNIYSAVAGLSQTAGHADLHGVDMCALRTYISRGGPFCICDGPDECRRAVRTQIRDGATVIKVMATGGVLSHIDDPHDAQFSPEELDVIVYEASKTGRIVAAHCHGKAGILAALKAGIKTIEHGTYLDDECIELMKEKDAMLVATSTIVQEGVKRPELMNPDSYVKMVEAAKYHEAAYKRAVKAGVKVALGTDLGVTSPKYEGVVHGNGGQELYWAVNAGMTPLEAIECATANGPLTLGERYAPKSGQLKEGYDADLIALNANPLKDIKLFSNPDNITHVWKGGQLFKSPTT